MSLLLLFGGSGQATPVPIRQIASAGGERTLQSAGAAQQVSSGGGLTTILSKG